MRGKKLLAAFLLGVGLCFIPALGYGEIILGPRITIGEGLSYREEPLWDKVKAMDTEISLLKLCIDLLEARIDYIMHNPAAFVEVDFFYDPDGRLGKFFPEGVDTKEKICIQVSDTRGLFPDKSGIALRDLFKRTLTVIYSFVAEIATDMDADIVAKFNSRERIPLGYFYQGEYHLWEK